jgi:hypothetical protein
MNVDLVRPRLAAIDLDGTLLGPDLRIGPENRAAVARLHAAGCAVVLASGRHHASMRPYAEQLPEVTWLVSCQGGEVADVARARVLAQHFLPRAEVERVVAWQAELGCGAVYYAADGVLRHGVSAEELAFYRGLTGLDPRPATAADWTRGGMLKSVWIGERARIDALGTDPRLGGAGVVQVRTHARLHEFMPAGVSKATGLAALARHLGVAAAEVVAFGDADNDVPMFRWAGRSFAMAHGWESARAQASNVAPAGAPESALARAVDVLLNA